MPIPTSWGSRYTFSRSCWPRIKMPALWIQAANVLWLLLGFFIACQRITALLFGKREVTNAAMNLLMLLCFEILLYVVFVYGNVPAFWLGHPCGAAPGQIF